MILDPSAVYFLPPVEFFHARLAESTHFKSLSLKARTPVHLPVSPGWSAHQVIVMIVAMTIFQRPADRHLFDGHGAESSSWQSALFLVRMGSVTQNSPLILIRNVPWPIQAM